MSSFGCGDGAGRGISLRFQRHSWKHGANHNPLPLIISFFPRSLCRAFHFSWLSNAFSTGGPAEFLAKRLSPGSFLQAPLQNDLSERPLLSTFILVQFSHYLNSRCGPDKIVLWGVLPPSVLRQRRNGVRHRMLQGEILLFAKTYYLSSRSCEPLVVMAFFCVSEAGVHLGDCLIALL